jgi:hypothetical protein
MEYTVFDLVYQMQCIKDMLQQIQNVKYTSL